MSCQALLHDAATGPTLTLRGTQVRILSTAADAAGASTFEFRAAPGFDTGSHLHAMIGEQFDVLDGQMELRAGDDVIVGGPVSFVTVPTGVPHGFANRTVAPARMLLICTPPGHERYFAELAAIRSRDGAPDPDETAALRGRYDTTQVLAMKV